MENLGYSPKDLKFGEEGRKKLIVGITKIATAVKSTLGSHGNTVLIESPQHTHGITVTKDGVTVANAIQLLDPIENLAVQMMKEAAERTSTSAGDGTTTAIVLTEALVLGGDELMRPHHNRVEVLRNMSDITKVIIDELRSKRKLLTKKMLHDIASISSNNDKTVGKVIADVYRGIGKHGIVTVEKSQTIDTYFETTTGLKIDRGYTSPLFINDQSKDECVFEDTHILVSDAEISSILQIDRLVKPLVDGNHKLLIIAPCSTNVVNTLASNVIKNNLKLCNIMPPSFGYRQHELMQDIAISIGAKYFSDKTGDDLSLMTFADLGFAPKVIVGGESTIIINSVEEPKPQVTERVAQLWNAHKLAKRKHDKDFILQRIASLTGGIGVIYVGGHTDLEQKELYDRVEDAVCAVRSAMEEGILEGGGKALWDIDLSRVVTHSEEEEVALEIIARALRAPLTQILTNAGLKVKDIYYAGIPQDMGFDVKNHKYGNMITMGVIDPLKVTRSALQNAVSVAMTILSTNAIITMARTYETK